MCGMKNTFNACDARDCIASTKISSDDIGDKCIAEELKA